MALSTLLTLLAFCAIGFAVLVVFAARNQNTLSPRRIAKMKAEVLRRDQAIKDADAEIVGILMAYLKLREPDFPINEDSCLQISRPKKFRFPRLIVDMGSYGRTTPIHPPGLVQDLLHSIYKDILVKKLGKRYTEDFLARENFHRRPALRELSRHEMLAYYPLAEKLFECHLEADRRSPYGQSGHGYAARA